MIEAIGYTALAFAIGVGIVLDEVIWRRYLRALRA